jgi:thiol-disulfide isomerase/thioredoxin
MNNKLALGIVVVLVIGAIAFLHKPAPSDDIQRVMPVAPQANDVQTAEQATTCFVPPSQEKTSSLAPELAGIAGYINTEPFALSELVGRKVILVDIWTYSCINCQRTLPYLVAWHGKYKDKGLEIVGVHSPEFDFEKKEENVRRAVEKFGITYPVVLDNDHATWNAWHNRYWPAKYLIDIDGHVAWYHFGEGAYGEAEQKIQAALAERAERLCLNETMNGLVSDVAAQRVEFEKIGTPEIYLGYVFSRGNFGNEQGLPAEETVKYSLPKSFSKNNVYLEGEWYIAKDHAKLVSDSGKVVLRYNAKNANIVASSTVGSGMTVFVDGQKTGTLGVEVEDLYNIVAGTDYGEHTLELDVSGAGFKLYTFTFG